MVYVIIKGECKKEKKCTQAVLNYFVSRDARKEFLIPLWLDIDEETTNIDTTG